MLRTLRLQFQLIRQGLSRPLREAAYAVPDDGRVLSLFHSRFNGQWFQDLGIEPRTILDVGAFDGGDAYRFARDYPSCRVISIEADPSRYATVQQNLAQSRAELANFAICAADGPVAWFPATIAGEIQAQGSLYQHTDHYNKAFPLVKQQQAPGQVQGARLDTLCRALRITDIDLLHMDIEGAEHAALQGLGHLRPRLIYAEMCQDRFVGVKSVQDTHQLLTRLGYALRLDLGVDRLYQFRKQAA